MPNAERQKVTVLKVTSEPIICLKEPEFSIQKEDGRPENIMTIYFDNVPTCRQIMIAASAFKNGMRKKTDFKSRKLKFYLTKTSESVRCQISDK
jgi:hypothetical protein